MNRIHRRLRRFNSGRYRRLVPRTVRERMEARGAPLPERYIGPPVVISVRHKNKAS
jgi:hypothetical protein